MLQQGIIRMLFSKSLLVVMGKIKVINAAHNSGNMLRGQRRSQGSYQSSLANALDAIEANDERVSRLVGKRGLPRLVSL